MHHFDSNLVIAPHPDGARLFRYTLVLNIDDSGKPARVTGGGPLQETLTKTPEGWFIKSRYYSPAAYGKPVDWPRFEGRPIAPPAAIQTPATRKAKPTLSALDYIEIEMLYGWNNIALDSKAENGEMFARMFTPDGMLQIDGRTITGRKSLADLAATGTPGVQRWLSNLYIEPSAEGAIGWAYVLNVDVGHSPAGRTIREGGLYRDVLMKTPEGWRFKTRVFTPGNTMPASLPLPKPR